MRCWRCVSRNCLAFYWEKNSCRNFSAEKVALTSALQAPSPAPCAGAPLASSANIKGNFECSSHAAIGRQLFRSVAVEKEKKIGINWNVVGSSCCSMSHVAARGNCVTERQGYGIWSFSERFARQKRGRLQVGVRCGACGMQCLVKDQTSIESIYSWAHLLDHCSNFVSQHKSHNLCEFCSAKAVVDNSRRISQLEVP